MGSVPIFSASREALERYRATLTENGEIARRRAAQNRHWFESELSAGLIERLAADPATAATIEKVTAEVVAGRRSPLSAAETVLAAWKGASPAPSGGKKPR